MSLISVMQLGPGDLDPVQGADAGPTAPVQLLGAARPARLAQHRRRVCARRDHRVRARALHAQRVDQHRPVQSGHGLDVRSSPRGVSFSRTTHFSVLLSAHSILRVKIERGLDWAQYHFSA